jgi:hypothetical protein
MFQISVFIYLFIKCSSLTIKPFCRRRRRRRSFLLSCSVVVVVEEAEAEAVVDSAVEAVVDSAVEAVEAEAVVDSVDGKLHNKKAAFCCCLMTMNDFLLSNFSFSSSY